MAELDDELYEAVTDLSEAGNELMDEAEYAEAVSRFEAALRLLPPPVQDWEAYTWLKASIADGLFLQHLYQAAKDELYDAMNGPDGASNPFVLLRLGQCLYELEDPRAVDYLTKAYLLEGEGIFAEEVDKYLDLVKQELAEK